MLRDAALTLRQSDKVRNTLNNHTYVICAAPSDKMRHGRATGIVEAVVRRVANGVEVGSRVKMDLFHCEKA